MNSPSSHSITDFECREIFKKIDDYLINAIIFSNVAIKLERRCFVARRGDQTTEKGHNLMDARE